MEFLVDGPDSAPFTIIFAHGAGVGMDAPFMTTFAAGLAAQGHRVIRFEFPYMAERRKDGTRRPPDKSAVLFETFLSVLRETGAPPEQVVLAGKSMGGRFATIMADQLRIAGVLVYGYPFHPPGKPEKLRTEHLAGLQTPTLICQGARDPFGTKDEVEGYALSPAIELCWLEDGDHGFRPRKASGLTEQMNWTVAIEASAGFLERAAARR